MNWFQEESRPFITYMGIITLQCYIQLFSQDVKNLNSKLNVSDFLSFPLIATTIRRIYVLTSSFSDSLDSSCKDI